MLKGKKFSVPIYRDRVEVIEGDPEQVRKERKIDVPDLSGYDGCAICFENKCHIVIMRPGTSIGTIISHEVYHLTDHIMKTSGVDYSDSSIEAFAYLHGYLMEKVLTCLGRNK